MFRTARLSGGAVQLLSPAYGMTTVAANARQKAGVVPGWSALHHHACNSRLWSRMQNQQHVSQSRMHFTTHAAAAAVPDVQASAPTSTLEGQIIADLQLGPLSILQQRLCVGGKDFTLIMPADVDAVIDLYIDAAINDGDAYWTRVWPSSIALASLILARPELVRGKKVADIGCGLGLAGMAAAMAGASEVVLLDREPLALHCALISAAASGLSPGVMSLEPEPLQGWQAAAAAAGPAAQAAAGTGGAVAAAAVSKALRQTLAGVKAAAGGTQQPRVTEPAEQQTVPKALEFRLEGAGLSRLHPGLQQQHQHQDSSSGSDGSARNLQGSPPPVVRARVFDWTQAQLLIEKFDVLLACDVLYEDNAVQPIAELVPLLLSAQPGSRLLLADPPTRTAHNRERFLELMREQQQLATRGSGAVRLVVEECSLHNCTSQQLDNEMVGGLPAAQCIPIQLMLLRQSLGGDTVGVKAL